MLLTLISLSVPSFVVNFKVGSSGDLALHINPRLTEGTVVRNSYLNGSWGSEEKKISYNPFGFGQFFDVSLGLLSPSVQSLCPDCGLTPPSPCSCPSAVAWIASRFMPMASTSLTTPIGFRPSRGWTLWRSRVMSPCPMSRSDLVLGPKPRGTHREGPHGTPF